MTHKLTKRAVLTGLTTQRYGRHLYVFEELDSTNACARTLAATGSPDGTTVLAEYQTAGRGRLGRSWMSEPGRNILVSVIIRPPAGTVVAMLPYIVGLAVAEAVGSTAGIRAAIKWPNDILVDGKKVCGILLEQEGTGTDAAIVAGIGINVGQTDFPPEIAGRATSLNAVAGAPVDRIVLLQTLLRTLEEKVALSSGKALGALLRDWSDRCMTLGRTITVEHGTQQVTGLAVGLSDDGGLLIEHDGRTEVVYAGDTTIITPRRQS